MGYGRYSSSDFVSYSKSTGKSYDSSTGRLSAGTSHQQIFKSSNLNSALDPKNAVRECADSLEHPETKPVVLALDVTGSMGQAAVEVASSINKIMTNLYGKVKDIEFMTMGIGDFAYDRCPLQVTQFESDIRIVEQMEKIYFEFGGGGNSFESYTAAWKFGLDNTRLDCYDKRGKKALLITMGDEMINPYISPERWNDIVGGQCQSIETPELYEAASKKFEIYHIHVDHHKYGYENSADSFRKILPEQHVMECKVSEIEDTITNIILDYYTNNNINTSQDNVITFAGLDDTDNTQEQSHSQRNENGEIVW